MKFADDIALGDFASAGFDDLVDEDGYSRGAKRSARLFTGVQLSFAISALLHFALASILFYFVASDVGRIEKLAPGLIRVEFVPSNPLLSQAEEVISQTTAENVAPTPLVEPDPDSMPVAQSQPESDQADVSGINEPEMAEAPPAENSNANSLRPVETIAVPSVESAQRVLSSLQRSDASRFTTYDCNKLEEEKEFNGCTPSDTRDYSSLTRNSVYDFHNPTIEISRSREAVTTLARQSARVSERLALSDLPPGQSAYMLEELEQGIETYSNNSNRALGHMNTMLDKSAAGVMGRRLFDNWVRQQSTMLQSRRVENRSDRQFRENVEVMRSLLWRPRNLLDVLQLEKAHSGLLSSSDLDSSVELPR